LVDNDSEKGTDSKNMGRDRETTAKTGKKDTLLELLNSESKSGVDEGLGGVAQK